MVDIKKENIEGVAKPEYLTEGVTLKDDEKINNFDDLKNKYGEMLDKFSNFEKKCKYLENQVKSLEKGKSKSKNKKKKFVGLHNTTATYANIDDDKTLPPGWKASWQCMDAINPGYRQKVYWAPNGRRCRSKVDALKRMVTEFDSSEEDIEIMKAGLVSDGWTMDDNLPEGWMYHSGTKLGKRFISKEYDYFKQIKHAVKHLGDNHSEEDLVKFLIKFHFKADISEISWLYDDSIPFPWRAGQTKNRNSSTQGQLVIAPDGQVVSGFKTAHDIMEKSGEVSKADLEKFNTFLTSGKYRGKPMSVKTEKIEKPEKPEKPKTDSNHDPLLVKSKGSSLLWKEDNSVPTGWKWALPEGECFGKKFKDPNGKFYTSRLEALRNMTKDESTNLEDIELMKEGLLSDGWSRSESLPSDWFCRKVRGTRAHQYVTRTLEIVEKMETVIKHMRENDYNEEEIDSFKEGNGLQWKTDEDLPEGWRYATFNNFKQGQLKNYMDPSGKYYYSIAQILKHFLEVDPNGEDLERTKTYLLKDGWFVTELLPPGWYMKQKKSENGFYYLTPTFDKFHATATMIQHLRDIKWDEKSVVKFQMNYKSLATNEITKRIKKRHDSTIEKNLDNTVEKEISDTDDDDEEEDVQLGLDWEDDIFLPEGWKTATTKLSSGKLVGTVFKRYMSPCENHFGTLAAALKFISEEGSVQESEMEILKQGLAYEGWTREEWLPAGWMSKETLSKRKTYLSPTLESFSETDDVVEYMRNNEYKEEEIKRFQPEHETVGAQPEITKDLTKTIKKEKNNVKGDNAEWKDDPLLPAGWQSAWYETASGERKTKFQKFKNGNDGRILNSRAQAVRLMMADGSSKEDIEKMKSTLPIDGWIPVDFLPGWMRRKSSNGCMNFLTPTFESIKSVKLALAFLATHNFDAEIIERLKTTSFHDDGLLKRKKAPEERMESPPKVIKLSNKKPLKDEKWKDGDKTIPEGWKISVNKQETKNNEFLSTKGHAFKTRVDGLKFMLEHRGIYNADNVKDLENTLHHEGWEVNSFLPHNWRLKKLGSEIHFLTGIYNVITAGKSARANIRKNFGQSELDNFAKLVDLLKPTNYDPYSAHRGDRLGISNIVSVKSEPADPLENLKTEKSYTPLQTQVESKKIKMEKTKGDFIAPSSNVVVKREVLDTDGAENEAIPKDWKTDIDENSEEILVSPMGTKFVSRVSAVEFMMKNNYNPQTIYNLWNSLDKEGWKIPNERVPSGWRFKYFEGIFDYRYLTKEMKIMESTEEAFTYIKESGEFDHLTVIKFESWVTEVKKASSAITWTADSSIPGSWQISSGLKQEILKNRKGSLFEGRKEAIDHMIKENYSPTDIFKLWNTLHLEGWVSDEENLPTGWKRKFLSGKQTHHYLSPMMEVIKSGAVLLDIVRKGKDYSKDEVTRVEKWINLNK